MNTATIAGAFVLGLITTPALFTIAHVSHHWKRERRYRKWQREYDEIYARHRHPSNRKDHL